MATGYGGTNNIFGPWETDFPGSSIAEVCTNLSNAIVPTYPIKMISYPVSSVVSITINGTNQSGFLVVRTDGTTVVDSVIAPSAGRMPLNWRFSDNYYQQLAAVVGGDAGIEETTCSVKQYDPPPTFIWTITAMAYKPGGGDVAVTFDPPTQLFVYVYYI